MTDRRATTLVRPRLGFLGVGWIGRNRMEAVAGTDAAEIAVVADASRETATRAAGAVGCARVGEGLKDLLDAGVDGVVIATPSALHAEQAIASLDAGVAVFCQKPLGRSAAEARRVVDAAERADRLLAVDLSYRHVRAVQAVRDLVVSGSLGAVYAVDLVFHNAYGPDKAWFNDRALSGGGCLVDLGTHLVDLALWTLGWPDVQHVNARILAAGRDVSPEGATVEDYASAQLRLAGADVRLACSWFLQAGVEAAIEATFYGTSGGASVRNVDGSFYDFRAVRFDGTTSSVLVEPPDPWGGRAIVAWARALAAGARFDPEIRRVEDVARTLDRIYAGAR